MDNAIKNWFEDKISEYKDLLKKESESMYLTFPSVFTNNKLILKMVYEDVIRVLEGNLDSYLDEDRDLGISEFAETHMDRFLSSLKDIRLDCSCSDMTEQIIKFETNKCLCRMFKQYLPVAADRKILTKLI